MSEYFAKDTAKLGFGLMRLPRHPGTEIIDTEETARMVDAFLAAGFTYFDTAYVYPGSEEACRKALVERHERGRYTLASKLNARAAKDEADARAQIHTSLARLGTDYLDYYLLHAVSRGNIEKYEEYRLWDYVKELKAEGLIRHYGFSFHDSAEILDELLTRHPDVEFVQLQLNYADLDNPAVQSRAIYETARRHGKAIVVMEPVKGGALSFLPEKAQRLFKEEAPERSVASWAVRYAASLDGIITVLSGMSDLSQMEDNLSYMKDFQPLSEREQEIVEKVRQVLQEIDQIPCTSCHYCTPGCPVRIPIPDIFKAMNRELVFRDERGAEHIYRMETEGESKARDCIACGQCEAVCPQQISIIRELARCAERFDR